MITKNKKMKTPIEKVLQNVVNEFEAEIRIFENIDNEFKDDMFYIDYTNISYIAYLNATARIKEVLFRMSINNAKKRK